MPISPYKETLEPINDKVVDLYQKLMQASVSPESIYIKAKETIDSVLEKADMSAKERGEMLGATVAGIITQLSAQSMTTAFQLAKDERDAPYELGKIAADIDIAHKTLDKMDRELDILEKTLEKMDKELEILDEEREKLKAETIVLKVTDEKVVAETAAIENDTRIKTAQGWLIQAQLYRDYGVLPGVGYSVETLNSGHFNAAYGVKYEEIQQAKAQRYVVYAGSVRQNGIVIPSVDTTTGTLNSATSDETGTAYWQGKVAERQERGFDDNMRQHVANSSAALISMLISSELDVADYSTYLSKWSTAIDYLNEV